MNLKASQHVESFLFTGLVSSVYKSFCSTQQGLDESLRPYWLSCSDALRKTGMFVSVTPFAISRIPSRTRVAYCLGGWAPMKLNPDPACSRTFAASLLPVCGHRCNHGGADSQIKSTGSIRISSTTVLWGYGLDCSTPSTNRNPSQCRR